MAADVSRAAARCGDIVARFYGRLRTLNLRPGPSPVVEIAYAPERTRYDPRRRVITAPAWSQAPEPLREQLRRWAGPSGGEISAEVLFQEIYQGFMIAHECTHAYQADLGFWRPAGDRFESEIIANRGATAFALRQSVGTIPLAELVSLVDIALQTTASPVLAGSDLRTFFNARNAAIEADPASREWFEATMMQIAWRRREELTFDALMTNLKLASS